MRKVALSLTLLVLSSGTVIACERRTPVRNFFNRIVNREVIRTKAVVTTNTVIQQKAQVTVCPDGKCPLPTKK